MPTIISSNGGPYSSIASWSGRPASTRSMMKSRITGCPLPLACLRTVFRALRSGRPASTAVASSRMMFASSVRFSPGRPGRDPEAARIAERNDGAASRPEPARGRTAGCGDGSSGPSASSCSGARPRDWSWRIAAARSGAATIPAAIAPPWSMHW